CRIASGQPHGRIWQQQRHRVIQTLRSVLASRGHRSYVGRIAAQVNGAQIKQVGIQAQGACVFVVYRSAEGENLPVRQNGRVHFVATRRHVHAGRPGRSCRVEIDEFGGLGGRASSTHDEDYRVVVLGGQQGKQNGTAVSARSSELGGCDIRGPRLRRGIEKGGRCA